MPIVRSTMGLAFNPAVTTPLAIALTLGPPQVRDPLLNFLQKYLSEVSIARLITALKWISAWGIAKKVNARLNEWALNHWQWSGRTKDWNWEKEVAVVTGGNSGIGKEIVKALMAKGIKVAVFDLQATPKDLEGYANMQYFYCDVTLPASIADAAQQLRLKWGEPSILVNNAGIGNPHSIMKSPPEAVAKIFTINTVSHFWTVREFMPAMVAKNKGHIVSMASMSSFTAPPGMVDYACTKASVMAFHEGLNMEIKHVHQTPGVLNTIVHPSWVRTPLLAGNEKQIEKTQGKLIPPEVIGQRVMEQIISCKGGQIIVPKRLAPVVAMIRGMPSWVSEWLRDSLFGRKKKGKGFSDQEQWKDKGNPGAPVS